MMNSPKVIYKGKYTYGLSNPLNHNSKDTKKIKTDINNMIDYYADKNKEVVGMIDYYMGSKQDNKLNLIMENGKYATSKDVEKIKKQFIKANENSNLWKGVISFDNEWLNQTVTIKELENVMAKEVIPKFLKKCGFVDMKKMRYCFSIHGNTNHLHIHLAFTELKPNYMNRDGKINYRRLGMITKDEREYLLNQTVISLERKSIMNPLITTLNKDVEELKKYFNSNDKNFILKDIKNIKMEEKIIRLGYLINMYRDGNIGKKVKYGSIKDNEIGMEIKNLTNEVKKYLFNDRSSILYKEKSKVDNDLKKLNNYYLKINEQNHFEKNLKENKLVITKEKYVDSFISNAIVNHAMFRTNKIYNTLKTKNTESKITLDDLLQELSFEQYQKYKTKNLKLMILKNNLSGNTNYQKFIISNNVMRTVKNLNDEMEEYAKEFHNLFVNKDYEKNNRG